MQRETETREAVDVLVITALLDELNALRDVDCGDGEWSEARDPDGFPYHYREIDSLRVAAAWAGEMGEEAAATRAASLIAHLNPECVAMCGICAGRKGDVFLGDVIVADRVYSYDHGKLVVGEQPNGQREERFYNDIKTYNLNAIWRVDASYFAKNPMYAKEIASKRPPSRARQESWIRQRLLECVTTSGPNPVNHPERPQRCPDWSERIKVLIAGGQIAIHEGNLTLTSKGEQLAQNERLIYPDSPDGHPGDPPFRLHVGTIATGKTVRQDPEIFERLARLIRKTIGIEMEAVAIGRVADELRRKAIIVKAVSDYGDNDKDDSFRKFAARASAETLIRFLRKHLKPLRKVSASDPLRIHRSNNGSTSKNPFETAGALQADHPTYVTRSCDNDLALALESRPLIAVEGEFSSGKSSLAYRFYAKLRETQRACYIDLQGCRSDDVHCFCDDFFEELSIKLDQGIKNWIQLGQKRDPPLALMIDEFGCLSSNIAPQFVPSLIHFAERHREWVRVIAFFPTNPKTESIGKFLKAAGIENAKYGRAWHRIKVPLLDVAGIRHLVALLPPHIQALMDHHIDVIVRISHGHPSAVQRVCGVLFDAAVKGASDKEVERIISASESYE